MSLTRDSDVIPYDDFGGRGPVLHFSHPNAYTPRCFRRFLRPLAERYRVIAAHHRPLWREKGRKGAGEQGSRSDLSPPLLRSPAPLPLFTGWDVITDDLLRFLDEQGMEGIIGVGHSLGAVATMGAALREPGRFRALVLIEPVFLPPAALDAIRADPQGAAERPMVQAALRRRDRWPNREAAFARFREKAVFERFSDEALWDYVNEGLYEDPATGEAVLSFAREWEAAFYARPPLDVWDDLSRLATLSMPTLAVRGAESDTLLPEAWALWQNLQPGAAFVEMEGVGHMLTMEAPEDAAAVVGHWLEDQGLL